MTLGFTSLGLVLVLLIIVPTLVFEKAFIYSVYLLICLRCNHKSLAFDTRVGHCILSILDWVLLSWKPPVGGYHQSLFGWPFSSVFVVPVVAQHYSRWENLTFVWIWAFHSLIALCASTLWYKNFISGLRSCENQHPLGWLIVELLQLNEEI